MHEQSGPVREDDVEPVNGRNVLDRGAAEFDADVRPFYEELGFAVTPVDGSKRFRGVLDCNGH
ncbi:hypothetical protein [Halosimplex sp. J119]